MNIYYFDENGNQTGSGTSATCPSEEATELVPSSSEDTWNGTKWISPPPPPPPTQEELAKEQQKAIDNAIQEALDKKAQEFRWDDMKSARAGAVSVKDTDSGIVRNMKENAQKLTDWYYEVWAYASQLEANVKNGDREIPTIEEVLLEMPKYEEQ